MAAPNSDNMTLTGTKNGTSSLDMLCNTSETKRLQAEVEHLRQKTRKLESENILREAEEAADFTYGQMDRVIHNVRNINYGMDKLESAIDIMRRDGALIFKTEGVKVNPNREAVSVIYMGMDQYVQKKKRISSTVALRELKELTGRINKYFEMRCRPADCFSKGGWQDHMFMFVLPATDREGAKTFLDRVIKNAIQGHEGAVSMMYGIANYAADVKELHAREPSRVIASRLLDAAKKIAKDQTSGYSGKVEKEAL